MTSQVTTPTTPVPRDRWGRPLVVPPGGKKAIAYTRVTTFVDALEDKYGLQKWMMRMTAVGLSQRQDLLLAVAANRDDKEELDKLCEAAKEAAAAKAAATTGSALHKLTETIDRGADPGVVPGEYAADLAAYTAATEVLEVVDIEEFCVHDQLHVGGTPDRVVAYQGKRYIADIKTGQVEYGALKIAMQLAFYARSRPYDPGTGERRSHGADVDRGLIVHLPAGTGSCTLHWVDLEAGWDAVQVAKTVREKRNVRFADVTEPFPGVPLLERIRGCTSVKEVRALWAANSSAWNDELTAAAKEHITSLPQQGATA